MNAFRAAWRTVKAPDRAMLVAAAPASAAAWVRVLVMFLLSPMYRLLPTRTTCATYSTQR